MVNMFLVDSRTACGCHGGGGTSTTTWVLLVVDRVKKVFIQALWSSRGCVGVMLHGGLELEGRQI